MFWRSRKKTLTISAELHEKIARSCEDLNEFPCEVSGVRTVRRNDRGKEVRRVQHAPRFSYGT
jgi:hypothetical protein